MTGSRGRCYEIPSRPATASGKFLADLIRSTPPPHPLLPLCGGLISLYVYGLVEVQYERKFLLILHRIFELQERAINSFITCFIFGIFSLFIAPFYFYTYYFLTAPSALFFIWVVPIIPFILVFDGLVSSLRTRTPAEVEALLQTCGADTTGWELKSGRKRFLWPTGYMSWIICTKK